MGIVSRLIGRERRSASYTKYGPGTGLIGGRAAPRTDAATLASVEAASSLIARCLGMAEVSGRLGPALGPLQLQTIARDLLNCGNSVWAIDMFGDQLALVPAASWDIKGESLNPRDWRYDPLELASPTGVLHRAVTGEDVLHFRLNPPPQQPWRGRSPLSRASLSARLAVLVEASLATEARFQRRQVMLSTKTMDPQTRREFEERLNRGASADTDPMGLEQSWSVLEAGNNSGIGDSGPPAYSFTRLGMQPDEGSVDLRSQVSLSVAAALGVPIELIQPGAGGGSSAREAYRRMLHSTIKPLAMLIEAEAAAKNVAVNLDLSGLAAADITGRARAYRSLVDSGMSADTAARIVGFEFGERER